MFRKIVLTVFVSSLLTTSCAWLGTKTILVPEGHPVQIRKELRNAPVWVYDEKGVRRESNLTIPAGWWALPDVFVEGFVESDMKKLKER